MVIMVFGLLVSCWLALVVLRKLKLTEEVYFSWVIPIFFTGVAAVIGLMVYNIMNSSGPGVALFNMMLLLGWVFYTLHRYKIYYKK